MYRVILPIMGRKCQNQHTRIEARVNQRGGSQKIRVIDSHTGGEPTRVVIEGGPDLGDGPLAERLERFRVHFDAVRAAVVNEPRGSDVMVGALLCPPQDPASVAGVIFFNNVGYLGMCGHGTMGVAKTLFHLGRISPGIHRLETPVGPVSFEYAIHGTVAVENVASYRYAKNTMVMVPGIGEVYGDIAWGGNWFFLVKEHGLDLTLDRVEELTDYTWRVRQALANTSITGAGGAEIDHIELFGPPSHPSAHSKNFVLCPGKAYDRSPCGTGTSAKMACLFADGILAEGEIWNQESIVGTLFSGSITQRENTLIPRISGTAFITAETTLIFDEHDPFPWGIRP